MNKRKVCIRADGNSVIGLGHLIRCLALAHMLKNEFSIWFYVKEIPESTFQNIKSENFGIKKINKEEEFLIKLSGEEIVVLDHYELDSEYQKKIKALGCKLICIDDLQDKKFYADLIINHSPGVSQKDYLAEPYTQFCLGLDYALLRPSFLEAAQLERNSQKIKSVFICFGGSDPENYTKTVLQEVMNWGPIKRINVVTGPSYLFENSLEMFMNNSLLYYWNDIKEDHMVNLLLKSDLAIVPASGILLEALSVGCKVISSFYVNNQKSIFRGFTELNAINVVNDFRDININSLFTLNTSETIKVIDGKSGKRLAKVISKL